jgi:hypothetical protein
VNKFIIWLERYIFGGFFFVLGAWFWSESETEKQIFENGSTLKILAWQILSYQAILWFASLIFFVVLVTFFKTAKEQITRQLAGIKERDERESYIVGKAALNSMVSTISVGILILFITMFSLSIKNLRPEDRYEDKKKNFSLALAYKVFDEQSSEISPTGEIIFQRKDLPLSKSSIVLILLIWQVGAFRFYARRISAEET